MAGILPGPRPHRLAPTVVLVQADDERLTRLLEVGASRANDHLVAIVTPELAARIGVEATPSPG